MPNVDESDSSVDDSDSCAFLFFKLSKLSVTFALLREALAVALDFSSKKTSGPVAKPARQFSHAMQIFLCL